MNSQIVSTVHFPNADYCLEAPFDPSHKITEFPESKVGQTENVVYDMVRSCLQCLKLDEINIGSERWSPFSELVGKGGTVFVKPNLAKHEHRLGEEGLICTITHGSVIRPLVDYAFKAVGNDGKIIIGDTPFEHTEWEPMMQLTGLESMVSELQERSYPVELVDLRKYTSVFLPGMRETKTILKDGDPNGYEEINLGSDSEFSDQDDTQQNYHTLADHSVDHYDPFTEDRGITNDYHSPGNHRYLVSKSILSADLLLNVPKLKTHGKAGVTLSLKNMIGIVSGKHYMPHHRPGLPPRGDAYPEPPDSSFVKHRMTRRKIAEKFSWIRKRLPLAVALLIEKYGRWTVLDNLFPVERYMQDRIEWGDWSGNDTLWRTIVDLNKIVIYADNHGVMRETPQRHYLSLVDGIRGQEGEGPTDGDPVESNVLIGGLNPVNVDSIACYIMGLDPTRIKVMKNSGNSSKYRIGDVDIEGIDIVNHGKIPSYSFRAPGNSPRAWRNKIEFQRSDYIADINSKPHVQMKS